MRAFTFVTLLFALPAAPAAAPLEQQAAPPRLRVFLECGCFDSYLREEITWVDYVRQPQDADVHLLSASRDTGGGGRELTLRFIGIGRLDGVSHELKVVTLVGETEQQRREAVLRTVLVGLLHLQARDGLPPGVDVSVRLPTARDEPAAAVRDPWNLWAFRVSADGSIEAEESNREFRWDVNFSGDRVTADWKVSFGIRIEQEEETFDLDDDDPFVVRQREREGDWFIARSLGHHWSIGLDGRVESSTFGNTRFSWQTAPAIEFSIFPYREYASRRFVVQYEIGVEHARYREITLFDKLEETNGRHELSATLDQRQPWGSLQLGAEWSQYLHDLGRYRAEVDGEISWRIARGLSLDIEGSASRIRDQISLPRRNATPQEVLLRLRELQSGYDVSFSIGLSYSFGSIFNNVVNPRFGG
jgi:hypothetical protein